MLSLFLIVQVRPESVFDTPVFHKLPVGQAPGLTRNLKFCYKAEVSMIGWNKIKNYEAKQNVKALFLRHSSLHDPTQFSSK